MKTKHLILCWLLAFVSSLSISAQTKPLVKYDKFKDRTLTYTPRHGLIGGYTHELDVVGYFSFKGKGAGHPIDEIGLLFFSRSKEWKFLKSSALNALVDGKRIPLGEPTSKDSDIPTVTSQYEDSWLSETLYFRVPYRTLTILTLANRVEMQLGRTEFILPASFLEDLRLLLAKVKRVK